jgi:hypothetical protein
MSPGSGERGTCLTCEAFQHITYFERYISEEDQTTPGKPLWVVATALICLGIAVWWVIAAL